MELLKLYIIFWAMAIFGWIIEVIVCSISDKKFDNRGFLIGPYCPIYGFGGLLLLGLERYQDDIIVVFFLSVILCSVVEYVTSYLMEKMFKIRWWDYSNDAFNVNGRICLRNCVAFGALGILLVCFLCPIINNFMDSLTSNQIIIMSVIIFAITFLDIICSFNVMKNIRKTIDKNLNSLENRDATEEIKNLINKTLLNKSYFERRFLKTYRHFLYKVKHKQNHNYEFLIIILIFSIIGLIVGLFLKSIQKYLSYGYIIGVFIAIIIYRVKVERKNGSK